MYGQETVETAAVAVSALMQLNEMTKASSVFEVLVMRGLAMEDMHMAEVSMRRDEGLEDAGMFEEQIEADPGMETK